MTTLAQLRKTALGLPEVEEGSGAGTVTFRVRGKGFASVTGAGVVRLPLPAERVAEAVQQHPTGQPVQRSGAPTGFAVPLADINGMHLNNLVYAAWRHRAPARLAARWDSGAEQATGSASRGDGGGHELPRAIGRPATAALLLEGISTLDQVAARSDQELLALHGVGPRAVQTLREEIAGRS